MTDTHKEQIAMAVGLLKVTAADEAGLIENYPRLATGRGTLWMAIMYDATKAVQSAVTNRDWALPQAVTFADAIGAEHGADDVERRALKLLDEALDDPAFDHIAKPNAAARLEPSRADCRALSKAMLTAPWRRTARDEWLAHIVVEAFAEDENRLKPLRPYRDGEVPKWLAILVMSVEDCLGSVGDDDALLASYDLLVTTAEDELFEKDAGHVTHQIVALMNETLDQPAFDHIEKPEAFERLDAYFHGDLSRKLAEMTNN